MNKKSIRQRLIPIVFLAFLAFLLLTYTNMKEESIPEGSDSISIEVLPDYKIVSGRDLSIWPKNTVFDQGMAAYFYAADPTVTITPVIRVNGIWQGQINGTVQSVTIIRAQNDKSEEFWSYRISHTAVQNFTLSNGSETGTDDPSYSAPAITFDAAAVYHQAAQINKELTLRSGTLQITVTSDIVLTGSMNGSAIHQTIRQELPITLQQDSFFVPRTQDAVTSITVSENVNPHIQQQIIRNIRTHLFLYSMDAVLAMLLLVLILSVQADKPKKEKEHNRYKEWITEGSVELKDKLNIHILKLEGLVDLAIDLDKRVIFDARMNQYYVLTEDIAYIYDPERSHSILENKTQLGKLLLDQGLLQPEQLEVGLHYQKLIGSRLGESLIALGFIDETVLYSTLAAQQGVNYYEYEPGKEITELGWLDRMSLQKARTLMSLPLGFNSEGKLVIACSETSREGVRKALQEMFGQEIILVAARPSAIYASLDRLDKKLTEKSNLKAFPADQADISNLLTKEEINQFRTSYRNGRIRGELLLRAAGQSETADGMITSLLKGLERALAAMDNQARQEKQLPGLTKVLCGANYLTPDTALRAEQESNLQGISIPLFLKMNLLASEVTIRQAEHLLETLKKILESD